MIDTTIRDGRPTEHVNATMILEHAPRNAGRLVEWMKTLTFEQLDVVWSMLVTEAIVNGAKVQDIGPVIDYVRRRYRERIDRAAAQREGRKLTTAERGERIRAGKARAWQKRNEGAPVALDTVLPNRAYPTIETEKVVAFMGDPAAVLTGDNDGG